ncbi:N-acetylmuramoyl-L-alanine amidase-like domain-containing protein [Mycoplasma elephantis]|uniref:N-acetylmuramoyl-L-alanine amidase-like domain-containing protein n=1 Tax=Mycoplasma elephantis TaxID=114882 RepID=UPI0004865AC2|nr:N-acetylmuramoyl-L-alanine amidase-like domain-containing protein [Mycoplasma elephantis]
MKYKKLCSVLIPVISIGITSSVISCSIDEEAIKNFEKNNEALINVDLAKLDNDILKNLEKAENEYLSLSKNEQDNKKDIGVKIQTIKGIKNSHDSYLKSYKSLLEMEDEKLENEYNARGYKIVYKAIEAFEKFNSLDDNTKNLLIKNLPNSYSSINDAKKDLERRENLLINLQKKDYPVKVPSQATYKKINELLEYVKSLSGKTMAEKVVAISEKFLGFTYVPDKMIGSIEKGVEEILVLDILGVDCFTFLDYTVALAMSKDIDEFKENVAKVRYIDGRVDYTTRKHFFTDWGHENIKIANNAVDLMAEDAKKIANDKKLIINIKKNINAKKEVDKKVTEFWLPGVRTTDREFDAIKFEKDHRILDEKFIMDNFKEGDFVMVGTNLDGLDVTHCGILIFKEGPVYEYDENGVEKRDEKGNPIVKKDKDGKEVKALKPFYRNAKWNKHVLDVDLLYYMRDRNWDTKNKKWYEKPKVPYMLFYRVEESLDD